MTNLTLTEEIYRRIKQKIVSFELPPGTPLKEQELSDWLEVSRTPIREALRLLESENLVEIRPRRGARVVQISRKDLQDAYEVRIWIEPEAAAKVADDIDPDTLEKLEATIEKIPSEPKTHEDAVEALKADLEFHRLIVEATGNRQAIQIVEGARGVTRRAAYFVPPGRYSRSRDEHRAVLDALKSRDADMARDLMREHLKAAASRMFVLSRGPGLSVDGDTKEEHIESHYPYSR